MFRRFCSTASEKLPADLTWVNLERIFATKEGVWKVLAAGAGSAFAADQLFLKWQLDTMKGHLETNTTKSDLKRQQDMITMDEHRKEDLAKIDLQHKEDLAKIDLQHKEDLAMIIQEMGKMEERLIKKLEKK
jgi:hypothetical protein